MNLPKEKALGSFHAHGNRERPAMPMYGALRWYTNMIQCMEMGSDSKSKLEGEG